MPEATFYAAAERFNLNAQFHGKSGKGDAFRVPEGLSKASRELARRRNTRFVLLGRAVGKCFGVSGPFLSRTVRDYGNEFLFFPHPSGINLWWNDARNRREASRVLRRFVNGRGSWRRKRTSRSSPTTRARARR